MSIPPHVAPPAAESDYTKVQKASQKDGLARARASRIRMLEMFAATLEEHQEGILNYYDYPISTGPLEGTNTKIQLMKRQATAAVIWSS